MSARLHRLSQPLLDMFLTFKSSIHTIAWFLLIVVVVC